MDYLQNKYGRKKEDFIVVIVDPAPFKLAVLKATLSRLKSIIFPSSLVRSSLASLTVSLASAPAQNLPAPQVTDLIEQFNHVIFRLRRTATSISVCYPLGKCQ